MSEIKVGDGETPWSELPSGFRAVEEEELLLLRQAVDRQWKQRTKDAERRTRQGRAEDAVRNVNDANGLRRIRARINRALRHVQKGSE